MLFLICVYFVLKCFRLLFYNCEIAYCEIAKTLPLCVFIWLLFFCIFWLYVLVRYWKKHFFNFFVYFQKYLQKTKLKKYGWDVSSTSISPQSSMKPSLYPAASFSMHVVFFPNFEQWALQNSIDLCLELHKTQK